MSPVHSLAWGIFQTWHLRWKSRLLWRLCSVSICHECHVQIIESVSYVRSVPVQPLQRPICALRLLSCKTCCRKCPWRDAVWYLGKWDGVTSPRYVNKRKHLLVSTHLDEQLESHEEKVWQKLLSFIAFSCAGRSVKVCHLFLRLKQQSEVKRATAAAHRSSLKKHVKHWDSSGSYGSGSGCTCVSVSVGLLILRSSRCLSSTLSWLGCFYWFPFSPFLASTSFSPTFASVLCLCLSFVHPININSLYFPGIHLDNYHAHPCVPALCLVSFENRGLLHASRLFLLSWDPVGIFHIVNV